MRIRILYAYPDSRLNRPGSVYGRRVVVIQLLWHVTICVIDDLTFFNSESHETLDLKKVRFIKLIFR